MTETLIVPKVAHILVSVEGNSFRIFSSEEKLLQVGKNGKTVDKFFITLFAQKNPERENFRRHF